jgi:hypothetical protein
MLQSWSGSPNAERFHIPSLVLLNPERHQVGHHSFGALSGKRVVNAMRDKNATFLWMSDSFHFISFVHL